MQLTGGYRLLEDLNEIVDITGSYSPRKRNGKGEWFVLWGNDGEYKLFGVSKKVTDKRKPWRTFQVLFTLYNAEEENLVLYGTSRNVSIKKLWQWSCTSDGSYSDRTKNYYKIKKRAVDFEKSEDLRAKCMVTLQKCCFKC